MKQNVANIWGGDTCSPQKIALFMPMSHVLGLGLGVDDEENWVAAAKEHEMLFL